MPVEIRQKKEKVLLTTDETPRRETTLEKLASLKTVYPDGICTAGNSSSENDGAAALVLTTPEQAREHGVEPMVYLKSFAVAAADIKTARFFTFAIMSIAPTSMVFSWGL